MIPSKESSGFCSAQHVLVCGHSTNVFGTCAEAQHHAASTGCGLTAQTSFPGQSVLPPHPSSANNQQVSLLPHVSHPTCPGPHCIIISLSTMFYKMSLGCPQPGSPHLLPSPKSHFTREQLHLLLPSCFNVVCLAAALRAATGAAQATR